MWRFPVWKRTIVMSAGSITHFVLALVALWIVARLRRPAQPGRSRPPRRRSAQRAGGDRARRRASVAGRTPARVRRPATRPARPRRRGLRDGDQIIAVNGTPVANYGELLDAIRGRQPGTGARSRTSATAQPATAHGRPRRSAARRRWTTRTAPGRAGRRARRRRSRPAPPTTVDVRPGRRRSARPATTTGDHGRAARSRR